MIFVLILIVLPHFYIFIDAGGCSRLKLCCQHRNASCMAEEIIPIYKNLMQNHEHIKNEEVDEKNLVRKTRNRENSIVDESGLIGDSEHEEIFRHFDPKNVSVNYENLDYGNGAGWEDLDVKNAINILGTDYTNEENSTLFGSHGAYFEPENNSFFENGNKNSVINIFGDRGHVRRQISDLIIDYNGQAKEISYIIVSDGTKAPGELSNLNGHSPYFEQQYKTRRCYCDEQCRLLNDCCSDYYDTCPVVDCRVNAWSAWSPCMNRASLDHDTEDQQGKCGPGLSKRSRQVVRQVENGGVTCPHVEEQKACYSADLNSKCGHVASELALLLPYMFTEARKLGYKTNLYYDLPKDADKNGGSSKYCSVFTITWHTANCTFIPVTDRLQKIDFQVDQQICVECQQAALGKNRIDKYYVYEYDPNLHMKRQKRVEPVLTGENIRCTGDGLLGVETLWSLLSTGADIHSSSNNHCFGQWILKHKMIDCVCESNYPDLPKFIFV